MSGLAPPLSPKDARRPRVMAAGCPTRLGVKAPWGSLRNTGPSRDWGTLLGGAGRFVTDYHEPDASSEMLRFFFATRRRRRRADFGIACLLRGVSH